MLATGYGVVNAVRSTNIVTAMEAILLRRIKRALLGATVAPATTVLSLGILITWPNPLFAFSLGSGKITVASDHPIMATALVLFPAAGTLGLCLVFRFWRSRLREWRRL
jgi:hypothetical protein